MINKKRVRKLDIQRTCRKHTTEIIAIIFRDMGIYIKNYCKFARNKKYQPLHLLFLNTLTLKMINKKKLIKTLANFTNYVMVFLHISV